MKPPSGLLKRSKKTILVLVVVIAITIMVTTLVATLLNRIGNLKIPSLATITTLGVEAYWDEDFTNKTESVKWGRIWVGVSQNVSLYIKSVSSVETTLQLETSNWNPASLSEYINLSWNYSGATIQPSQIIEVTLTLSVSSSDSLMEYLVTHDVKQFSFDILISTSEHV